MDDDTISLFDLLRRDRFAILCERRLRRERHVYARTTSCGDCDARVAHLRDRPHYVLLVPMRERQAGDEDN